MAATAIAETKTKIVLQRQKQTCVVTTVIIRNEN